MPPRKVNRVKLISRVKKFKNERERRNFEELSRKLEERANKGKSVIRDPNEFSRNSAKLNTGNTYTEIFAPIAQSNLTIRPVIDKPKQTTTQSFWATAPKHRLTDTVRKNIPEYLVLLCRSLGISEKSSPSFIMRTIKQKMGTSSMNDILNKSGINPVLLRKLDIMDSLRSGRLDLISKSDWNFIQKTYGVHDLAYKLRGAFKFIEDAGLGDKVGITSILDGKKPEDVLLLKLIRRENVPTALPYSSLNIMIRRGQNNSRWRTKKIPFNFNLEDMSLNSSKGYNVSHHAGEEVNETAKLYNEYSRGDALFDIEKNALEISNRGLLIPVNGDIHNLIKHRFKGQSGSILTTPNEYGGSTIVDANTGNSLGEVYITEQGDYIVKDHINNLEYLCDPTTGETILSNDSGEILGKTFNRDGSFSYFKNGGNINKLFGNIKKYIFNGN